jgi:Nuclease-related domain.
MIEFYPDNLIGNDFDSPGEFELYKKFKELSARRNWVVFHSQGVHKHVSQFMGEIDYVIIMPKVGVLTVEVKACKTLLFDPKLAKPWKIGSKDYEKRGPFKQAEDNSRSLKEFFHAEYPVLKNVLFWHTVVFTEIRF